MANQIDCLCILQSYFSSNYWVLPRLAQQIELDTAWISRKVRYHMPETVYLCERNTCQIENIHCLGKLQLHGLTNKSN